MIRFSKEKVLLLHKIMAEATGGSVGVRDEGLLDAALDNAFAGFGEHEFYPIKEEKGARLGFELASVLSRIFLSIQQKDLWTSNISTGLFDKPFLYSASTFHSLRQRMTGLSPCHSMGSHT